MLEFGCVRYLVKCDCMVQLQLPLILGSLSRLGDKKKVSMEFRNPQRARRRRCVNKPSSSSTPPLVLAWLHGKHKHKSNVFQHSVMLRAMVVGIGNREYICITPSFLVLHLNYTNHVCYATH